MARPQTKVWPRRCSVTFPWTASESKIGDNDLSVALCMLQSGWQLRAEHLAVGCSVRSRLRVAVSGVSGRSEAPPRTAASSQVPPVIAAAAAPDSSIAVHGPACERPLRAIPDVSTNLLKLNLGADVSAETGAVHTGE